MRPQAIFFDLDDTIADRQGAIYRYAERLAQDFAEALGEASLMDVHQAILHADDFGSLLQCQTLAGSPIWAQPPSPAALEAHWSASYGACATPFPGALPLIEDLARRGYRLGIVTNGHRAMQRAKIEALGIAPLMHAIVVSAEVGLRKPDRRIFEHAAALVGSSCADCWFVGDNPHDDMHGALGAGLRAFRVRTGAFAHIDGPGVALAALADLAMHLDGF